MQFNFLAGILYVAAAIIHIYFSKKNYTIGRMLTKPLLMPLLLLFYFLNTDHYNLLIVSALIASFLGDVLLIWSKRKSFVLGGISAFLIGHIFYIVAFLDTSARVPIWIYSFALIYILIGTIVESKLSPFLNTMKIPVRMYMVVILLMSFFSLTRFWSVSFISFLFPFLGSVLFIVSDTLLAFDMFTDKKQVNHAAIMSTYILAQGFIVLGFIQ